MLGSLYVILRIEAALCVLFGLWSHDWRLIVAGAGCWLVMPLIGKELSAGQ